MKINENKGSQQSTQTSEPKKVENELISDGSEYNVIFINCKFQSFKPKDYVNCKFVNCSFPNQYDIGLLILDDNMNQYENCDINIDNIIKKLFGMTNGVASLVSSINAFLNKSNNLDECKQVVDIGKIKNTKSFLAVI